MALQLGEINGHADEINPCAEQTKLLHRCLIEDG